MADQGSVVTTKVRPVVGFPGKRRATAEPSNRLSTCKNCGYGVFKDQPHRWQTGRLLGLAHDYDCAGEPSCNP